MTNIAKYFVLLENLTFKNAAIIQPKTVATQLPTSLIANLGVLEKYVQQDVKQQLQDLLAGLQQNDDNLQINTEKIINCYIIRLLHVVQTLVNNINFHSDAKEDLISVAHLKLCIQTIQELSYYGLRMQLDTDFYKSPMFEGAHAEEQLRCDTSLLFLSVQYFLQLLPIRQFHIANSMELVKRDLLSAVMSLHMQDLQPDQKRKNNTAFMYLWKNESKSDLFRHLLILKGTKELSASVHKQLHHMLLRALNFEDGYVSLVSALTSFPNMNYTLIAETMAKIVTTVAACGYTQIAQQRFVDQIFNFCCLEAPLNFLCVGVLSLRRLCELNVDNRQRIEQILISHWQPLSTPKDLLSGIIVWEQAELCKRIRLWHLLFCSSSVACLPSDMLITYMPLLMQLHQQIPENLQEWQNLSSIITRCLDNRETSKELPELLLLLYKSHVDRPPIFQTMHPRLKIVQKDQVKVQVSQKERDLDQECCVLASIVMSGSDQALSCKIFLALFSLMLKQLTTDTGLAITDLLSTEAELADFLQGKYQLRLQLLLALTQLIDHQPLRKQLAATHSTQFIRLLVEFLEKSKKVKVDETLLLMLLLLMQELLENNEQLQLSESAQRLKKLLAAVPRVGGKTDNVLYRGPLLSLQELLGGLKPSSQAALASFQQARELIEDQQPHIQVHGIQLMVNALKKKDPEFISQAPRIIALALSTLKNKESYTFLNCVRLFVALVDIMESDVLAILSDEYLSETADLDFRLVVGEAILKAASKIGPLCYRYKAVLFNCFLHGARSPLDEFRTSAYANLAQICRLLAYQVHSFFQELMQLIDAELSNGRYVPAQRGALLVLAELLEGMESLLDYQDMLLPIYRLLRTIEAAETCDPQMRQHAANGLKIIKEKCQQLFRNESMDQMQKKIKVLGIKDNIKTGKKHILELN